MSKGEDRVGITFNPSKLEAVNQVKGVVAACIDNLEPKEETSDEVKRCAKIAQYHFEMAAMWAVKAITKENTNVN